MLNTNLNSVCVYNRLDCSVYVGIAVEIPCKNCYVIHTKYKSIGTVTCCAAVDFYNYYYSKRSKVKTVKLKKCFILICFKFYIKVKANQGLQSIKPNSLSVYMCIL